VIEDTIRQTLPEGFQTAEFALERGLIDAIVDRCDLRAFLAHALAIHMVSVQERQHRLLQEADSTTAADALTALGVKPDEEASTTGSFARIVSPAESNVVDMKIYNYRMIEDRLQSPNGVAAHESAYTMNQRTPGVAAGLVNRARDAKPESQGILSGVKSAVAGAVQSVTGKNARRVFETEDSAIRRELSKRSVADAPGVRPVANANSGHAKDAASENAAWESVLLARNVHRPTAKYYIDSIVDGFIELHGDRAFGDDGAILAGIGWIQGYPVTVIAEEKGEDLNQRIARNFGCPQPEGYRKSLRLMKQAEKFGRPIVCLVDTQGAFCGMEAEERGQGNAIADNLVALSGIGVPVISVVLGEGGSGGALALAVGNRVAMQKHAVYSVLSPEGFASILWKDRSRAAEAAAVMKMSADEACSMGIIEEVLSEGEGPAHENPEVAAANVKEFVLRSLRELSPLTAQELRDQRYNRFRKF
jgi:acetyl-CoA carboxylase carboxyl transferase subunit beta